MDHYVTGAAIRALREKQGMTQAELAEKLCVSDKAVSKWETGRGFPDVSLLEPLGKALRISIPELLCGQAIVNGNRSANMLKSRFYVCPVCGNVIFARGETMISCCGIRLPALEAEKAQLEVRLSSGTLDPGQLQEASARYGALQEVLDEAEMRWLELTDL